MSNNPLDILVPQRAAETPARYAWATVASTSPLRVQPDGDSQIIEARPSTLVSPLAVADRVYVQVVNQRVVILGRAGGQAPLPDVIVNIPGSADLDTYLTPGQYVQRTNSNAASGSNYPEPLAGVLEVGGSGSSTNGDIIIQRYTLYAQAGTQRAMYRREAYHASGSLTWSSWAKIVTGGISNTIHIGGVDYVASGVFAETGAPDTLTNVGSVAYYGAKSLTRPYAPPSGWGFTAYILTTNRYATGALGSPTASPLSFRYFQIGSASVDASTRYGWRLVPVP